MYLRWNEFKLNLFALLPSILFVTNFKVYDTIQTVHRELKINILNQNDNKLNPKLLMFCCSQ